MKKQRKLGLENLQKREMMASDVFDISFDAADGELTVSGTYGKDDVALEIADDKLKIRMESQISGRTAIRQSVHDLETVKKVLVDTHWGDDQIVVKETHRPGTITVGGVRRGPAIDIRAGSGNDHVENQTSEFVVVRGEWGDDTLIGGPSDDRLYGGDGNDEIKGQGGNDILSGGRGNDRISGGDGDDRIYGSSGNDTIYGGKGDDRMSGGSGVDVVWGGVGDDSISGGSGADILWGGNGDDEIRGNSGNDMIFGMLGDDTLFGHHGNDTISGGKGNDVLFGGYGTSLSVASRDRVSVPRHLFRYYMDTGHDTLHGNDGHDRMYGERGNDQLRGGDGHDSLWGGKGQDYLWGEAGNDYLFGYAIPGYPDYVHGGSGADRFEYERETTGFIFKNRRNINVPQDFNDGRRHYPRNFQNKFKNINGYRGPNEGDRLVNYDPYEFNSHRSLGSVLSSIPVLTDGFDESERIPGIARKLEYRGETYWVQDARTKDTHFSNRVSVSR